MELVGPVYDIVRSSCHHIVERIGYTSNWKKNLKELKDNAEDIFNRRGDIKLEISRDSISKKPTSECEGWLKKVEEIENQLKEIEKIYERDGKCLRGWFFDVFIHMKMGKRVKHLTNSILNLKEISKFSGGIVVDILPKVSEAMPALKIEAATSTACTLQKVLESMRDASIQKIGIWGMGGIGKTTIMRNLNNLTELTQMFDIVIWVTLSREWSIENIQNEVARRLSLTFPHDESRERVKSILFQHLQGKKFLLLLDDVWDKVDLDEIGIPALNEQNGCKVVLTSRSRGICNKMETDLEIKVDVLSKQEAWTLFHEKAGNIINSSSIQPLARCVIEECAGLPLAIIAVGSALRKEDSVHVWMNAVKELKSGNTADISDMEDVVFRRLRFSFDRLKDDNVKNCFLYCALYPEDYEINISELIEYWHAEGFIDRKKSLSEAHNKGCALLKYLVDMSLLELCDKKEFVRMHDVVRDLALSITLEKGEGSNFLVRAGLGLSEPPADEDWVHAKRISLTDNKLEYLPERPNSLMLTTLFLRGNYSLRVIPDSFFMQMVGLRVLVLQGTSIVSLPPSFSSLVNLRVLQLGYCKNLIALPAGVGELKALEILDLPLFPGIEGLPAEICELTSLRRLRVSLRKGTQSEDMMTPPVSLSKLGLIEQLTTGINPDDQWWHENVEFLTKELASLKKLACLDYYFPKAEHIEIFIKRSSSWITGRLASFRFITGLEIVDSWTMFDWHETHPGWNRQLIFMNGDSISYAISEVLSRSDILYLVRHKTTRKLSEFGAENLKGLKFIEVRGCHQMETLIDGNCSLSLSDSLEELHVENMRELKCIWDASNTNTISESKFLNLRVLALLDCAVLTNIFMQTTMMNQLVNLEVLAVHRCRSIKEIVTVSDAEAGCDTVILPKLKDLELVELPQLVGFCSGGESSVLRFCPSLERLEVHKCFSLRSLHPLLNEQNAVSMRTVSCSSREWWDELEWRVENSSIRDKLRSVLPWGKATDEIKHVA